MRKLELDILKSLRTKDKILLILVVTILIWAVFYRKIHLPNIARIKALQSQIRETEDKTFKLEDQLPSSYKKLENYLEDLKQEHQIVQAELDEVYSEMPQKDQSSELLKYLTQKDSSSDSGELEFVFVKSEPIEEKEFYHKMPLKISLTGNYNQIISYLKRIEIPSRLIEVKSLQIQTDPEILPGVNVNMSLLVLLQNPSEEKSSSFAEKLSSVNLKKSVVKKLTDPFTAYRPIYLMGAKSSELPEIDSLSLSGIIWSGGTPSAVINGISVKVGDDIDGLEVLEISEDGVMLEGAGQRAKLKLK
ncbi:MAG: type 4a pilus biogenesis protein PilO [Candidatus Omnitrophota bacterium]